MTWAIAPAYLISSFLYSSQTAVITRHDCLPGKLDLDAQQHSNACRSLQLDSKHGVIESTRQSYSRELADDAGPVLTSASAKDPCVGDALLGEYSLFALRTFTANLSNPALKEFSDVP